MPRIFLLTLGLATLLTTACSQAQSDTANDLTATSGTSDQNDDQGDGQKSGKKGKKGKKDKKGNDSNAPLGVLQPVGELQGGIPESSGLAHGGRPGTFYTHGDAGTSPTLYLINEKGEKLGERELPITNIDWESLADDGKGTVFVTDAGNNNNTRRDLVIYRVDPQTPNSVGKINFRYADQKAFPPAKDERNFDCEASLWNAGQLYLFTKDRANQAISKVYRLSDQPGTHVAELQTQLRVAGEVTGADLSPDGRHLALMGREELYLLEGTDLNSALKATPKVVSLKGAGQTEAVLFLDNSTLLISTEQGALYRYKL